MTQADPCFPQMSDALNPELMAPLLRQILNLSASVPQSWSIGEKRYRPSKSLLINYQLNTQENGSHSTRHVTGRLCTPGEAHIEFERELAKRPELIAGALTYLVEPAMVLWVFPYDRNLKHLPPLLAAESLQTQLPTKLVALDIVDHQILSVHSEVLHYLAERSCMIRYRIEYEQVLTSSKGTIRIYAKNYADHAGAYVFSVMRQLGNQFADGAKALAYDTETRTLWQSHVSGSTLTWADLKSDSGAEIIQKIGLCVARFHACTISTQRNFTQDDVLQDLQQTIDIAERTFTELGVAIRQAVTSLMTVCPTFAGYVATPIHHDLKLNNFLVDGTSIGLIDLDCVCLGNPLTDLASLIANFYLNGLREGETAECVHSLVNILISAYSENSLNPISLPELFWQVAAALIHEVTRRSLRQLDSQRIKHIHSYLALSQLYATNCLAAQEKP